MECKCKGWRKSADQIFSLQATAAIIRNIKYTGDQFKFCPWCGKSLDTRPPEAEGDCERCGHPKDIHPLAKCWGEEPKPEAKGELEELRGKVREFIEQFDYDRTYIEDEIGILRAAVEKPAANVPTESVTQPEIDFCPSCGTAIGVATDGLPEAKASKSFEALLKDDRFNEGLDIYPPPEKREK